MELVTSRRSARDSSQEEVERHCFLIDINEAAEEPPSTLLSSRRRLRTVDKDLGGSLERISTVNSSGSALVGEAAVVPATDQKEKQKDVSEFTLSFKANRSITDDLILVHRTASI